MSAGLAPEGLDPIPAVGVVDGGVDGLVAADAAGVGEHRVRTVEQPEFALLVRENVVHDERSGLLPRRSARRKPAGDDPFAVGFGRHRRGVEVAPGFRDGIPVGIGGHGRDPVHHRRGEVDVLVDPAEQVRIEEIDQITNDLLGDDTVLRQVVARQDGDGPGTAAPAGEKSGGQPGGQRPDGCALIDAQRGDVIAHCVGVEVSVRSSEITRLGDRDGDQRDLGASEIVQVRLVVGRRVHGRQ